MKLSVVFEKDKVVVARDNEGQLYVGGYVVDEPDEESEELRTFMKIQSYSLRHNGDTELDTYTLEDGSRVGPVGVGLFF